MECPIGVSSPANIKTLHDFSLSHSDEGYINKCSYLQAAIREPDSTPSFQSAMRTPAENIKKTQIMFFNKKCWSFKKLKTKYTNANKCLGRISVVFSIFKTRKCFWEHIRSTANITCTDSMNQNLQYLRALSLLTSPSFYVFYMMCFPSILYKL